MKKFDPPSLQQACAKSRQQSISKPVPACTPNTLDRTRLGGPDSFARRAPFFRTISFRAEEGPNVSTTGKNDHELTARKQFEGSSQRSRTPFVADRRSKFREDLQGAGASPSELYGLGYIDVSSVEVHPSPWGSIDSISTAGDQLPTIGIDISTSDLAADLQTLQEVSTRETRSADQSDLVSSTTSRKHKFSTNQIRTFLRKLSLGKEKRAEKADHERKRRESEARARRVDERMKEDIRRHKEKNKIIMVVSKERLQNQRKITLAQETARARRLSSSSQKSELMATVAEPRQCTYSSYALDSGHLKHQR